MTFTITFRFSRYIEYIIINMAPWISWIHLKFHRILEWHIYFLIRNKWSQLVLVLFDMTWSNATKFRVLLWQFFCNTQKYLNNNFKLLIHLWIFLTNVNRNILPFSLSTLILKHWWLAQLRINTSPEEVNNNSFYPSCLVSFMR